MIDFKGLMDRAAAAGHRLWLGRSDKAEAPQVDPQQLRAAMLVGAGMDALLHTPGWQQMDALLEQRQQVVFDEWTKSDPKDMAKQISLQQEVRLLAEIREMPIRLADEGKKAAQTMKELEDGSGEHRQAG